MSKEVVKRLRGQWGYGPHGRSTLPVNWQKGLDEAADLIEAQAAKIFYMELSFEAEKEKSTYWRARSEKAEAKIAELEGKVNHNAITAQHQHERAEKAEARLAEANRALLEIETRPDKITWGEFRDAMRDMEDIARRALKGGSDNG